MNRWLAGILIAFAVVVVANGVLVYLALENAPMVVESYVAQPR